MNLPAMPTRNWLRRLPNESLLQLEQRSREETQALRQEISRLYRKRPSPARDALVRQASMELFRQEVFAWFAWAEILQREGLIRLSGSNTPPPAVGIGSITSLSDYQTGRAEKTLLNWLERFAKHRNQEQLLTDLRRVLDEHESQSEAEVVERSELKRLFRDIAKSIHPDLDVFSDTQSLRNSLMAKANKAYEERNAAELREILASLQEQV